MKPNKKSMDRTLLSILILLAYFFLNVWFAAGSVLCIQSDGEVSFKFNSCEFCCSSDSSHADESLNDNGWSSKELQTKDSCCPCSDIPVSSYISQFYSRIPKDMEASCVYVTSISGLFFTPKTTVIDFREPRKLTHKNQISSLLKTAVLLN